MEEKKEGLITKIIDILKTPRVLVLLFFIIISLFAINYTFQSDGIVIDGVSPGMAAERAGISFDSRASQRDHEKILAINSNDIKTQEDYYGILQSLTLPTNITLITNINRNGYLIELLGNENQTAEDVIGMSVRDAPTSNIRLGIELEGGTRIIMKALNENMTREEYDMLISTLQNRLDVYGASGTKVNKLEDAFSNDRFVLVESLSSNKNDIYELIQRQGEFQAVLANETVFTGNNILRVFPTGNFQGCPRTGTGDFICTYAFSVEIDSQGADAFFNIARDLPIVNNYLSEKIYFYLDGNEITGLNVASSFKFNRITTPQITVSGNPMPTEQLALESARQEMRFLQAILSTQSLPSELEVMQSYSIESSRGEEFLRNSILIGIAAILLVAGTIAIIYRHIGLFVAVMIALISEILIIFGLAAFLKLSIDLAAIGGLIAAIGTGVDDQIIITNEYFRKRKNELTSRKKIKAAFYIILISFFTTLAAMIPLYFAGLKILQGFAFMIIVGVTVGVLITRPAFGAMLRIMTTTREQRKKEAEDDN